MNRIEKKELAPDAARLFEEEVLELIPDISRTELCAMVDDFIYYQTDRMSREEARALVDRICRRTADSTKGRSSRAAQMRGKGHAFTAEQGGQAMKIQKIGIIGSGHIGGNLGVMLAKAGYEVVLSSRHPDRLKDLVKEAGPKACTGTVAEAAAFGEVIVLSLPLKAIPELDTGIQEALKGKIVIDTSNPYPERDGAIAEAARRDPGGMGVVVARLLPASRIIRAFNTVYFEDLKRTTTGSGEKIGIPLAGDDQEGLEAAVALVERIGLDPVVVGALTTAKQFDVGTAVYATGASAREIREKLNIKPAGRRAA